MLLAGNPFTTIANDLNQDLATIQGVVNGFANTVQPLHQLPFIGDKFGALDDVQHFVNTFSSRLHDALTGLANLPIPQDIEDIFPQVRTAIFNALGPSGVNVLARCRAASRSRPPTRRATSTSRTPTTSGRTDSASRSTCTRTRGRAPRSTSAPGCPGCRSR